MGSGGSLPAIATRSSNPLLFCGCGWLVRECCDAWMISVHGALFKESVYE